MEINREETNMVLFGGECFAVFVLHFKFFLDSCQHFSFAIGYLRHAVVGLKREGKIKHNTKVNLKEKKAYTTNPFTHPDRGGDTDSRAF